MKQNNSKGLVFGILLFVLGTFFGSAQTYLALNYTKLPTIQLPKLLSPIPAKDIVPTATETPTETPTPTIEPTETPTPVYRKRILPTEVITPTGL